jgi:hypothetical protein
MTNVTDMGPYRRRKGGASRIGVERMHPHATPDIAIANHERTMAAVSALAGIPYVPENDDMRELLNARLGVFE